MRQVKRVWIEPAGIGRVREVADAIKEVGGFTRHQDDRPSETEPHDFIGRQQRPALDVLADAGGRAARLGQALGLRWTSFVSRKRWSAGRARRVVTAVPKNCCEVLARKLCQRG